MRKPASQNAMSERITHQPSPIELLFPQGLALLEPKPIQSLPQDAKALERWINRFIIEPKWRGIRAAAEIQADGQVRILTKEGYIAGFPDLRERLKRLRQGRTILLDGEIIAGAGKTAREEQTVSSQAFSGFIHERGNIKFVAFDLLMLDDVSLIDFPIQGRKRALARIIPYDTQRELNIGLTDFALEDHLSFMGGAQRERFEGVVLKRKGSKYREPHPRARAPHPWLKYKFR